MKALLTGAAGVVGRELWSHLRERGTEVVAVDIAGGPDVVRADLRDAETVGGLLEKHRPDLLLHLAANKNVFFCEEYQEIAHEVNYHMTETLARACAGFGTRMVFLSSDYVFGTGPGVFVEDSVLCPTTQYGRDKAASEKIIGELLTDFAIVRTAGLYGFSGDLIQVVTSSLSQGNAFNAFDNLINCPTWTGDLFRMLDVILDEHRIGIFHCIGPEALSRFDYACCVAEAFGLKASLVRAEPLDFTKDIRPPALRLDGTVTYGRLGVVPDSLTGNLRKIKNEYYR